MGVALIFSKGVSGNFLELTSIERLARLSLIIGFGSAAYFATLWCCGFRLHDFKRYVTAAALSSTSKCDNSKTTEE
jgi:putative peptidoglycan lipid II flippase